MGKVRARVSRVLESRRVRRADLTRSTYSDAPVPGELHRYFAAPAAPPEQALLVELCGQYLAHRFDLLGSGWVCVQYGMACTGVEGTRYEAPNVPADLADLVTPADRPESRRIRRLISEGYEPIDWQRDFKSGWRWSESTWSRDIAYGTRPGVDIKVPWELARLQHLPQMGIAACTGRGAPDSLAREFRDQVLDFVAANPPRFGANWVCTMDVAIRVANMLTAYDFFRAAGVAFDGTFDQVLRRSAFEHGTHIAANLEWSEDLRSNHYLADICGLLFVAAYLPSSSEVDEWLRFAHRELLAEAALQFHGDGSNFEASTSYHRLSAEMVLFGTALVAGLPTGKRALLDEDPLPSWLFERIATMAEFSMDATRPDGRIVQFGDNDSGRFLKLSPIYECTTVAEAKAGFANLDGYSGLPDDAAYLVEDHLDHRHLVAACAGLLSRDDFPAFAIGNDFETEVIRKLAPEASWLAPAGAPRRRSLDRRLGTNEVWAAHWQAASAAASSLTQEFAAEAPGDLRARLESAAYQDFGLYVVRSPRLYLAVRCGEIGQNGNGGHAHNDQLSIELVLDGRDLVRDPGTYLYTPLPGRRNEYRSVGAHAVARVSGREPSRIDLGLFAMCGDPKARCLFFDESANGFGFLGCHEGYGALYCRRIEVLEDRVRITDWSDSLALVPSEPHVPFSPGYGIVERRSR
ncbi:MAG: heparinase II/III domain-containing protein [Thermoleophilia bacterium]